MKIYPIKTPKFISSIFKEWIWSFSTNKKEVYLTFDDGPIPEITPWVLAQLKQYHAKATFFCIGDNIKKHPEIFQELQNSSHSIGNHTFNHLNGWNFNSDEYLKNTLLADSYFPNNYTPKLFRPPYGKISQKQSKLLRSLGYKIIMWHVLSGDFDKDISAEKCTKNVLKNIKNGSIVVFHDSQKAFPRLKETLPTVLKELHRRGYTFKAIS